VAGTDPGLIVSPRLLFRQLCSRGTAFAVRMCRLTRWATRQGSCLSAPVLRQLRPSKAARRGRLGARFGSGGWHCGGGSAGLNIVEILITIDRRSGVPISAAFPGDKDVVCLVDKQLGFAQVPDD
jgi:hypothetical protein